MAHVNHLQGQDVNILLDLSGTGNTFTPVAASTSCDFQVSAQTEETQAKDDPGNGEWAAPQFSYYDWNGSNSSYLVSIPYLFALLNKVVNGDAMVAVQFQTPGQYANQCVWKGLAIVSSLKITGAMDEKVKVDISLEGANTLIRGQFENIAPAAQITDKIAGKALMVAIKQNNVWDTILCSSSHTLEIAVETQDIRDKDHNDQSVHKTVKSRSVTVSSESFVPASNSSSLAGTGADFLMGLVTTGALCHLAFGYYPDSIGTDVESVSQDKRSWGSPSTVLLEGNFLLTGFTPASGENQEDSKMSAEFHNVGKVTVIPPVTSPAPNE